MPDVDLDQAEDEPPQNLPFQRSGTQIFEDSADQDVLTQVEKENIEENMVVDLEQMWKDYEEDPNFFQAIEIAKDGGFSEVGELVGFMRYIFAGMTVSFVLLNIYSIVTVNLGLIFSDEDKEIYLVTKEYILKPLGLKEKVGRDLAIIGALEIGLIIYYVLRLLWWGFRIGCPAGGLEMRRWQAVQEFFWNALPEASTMSAVKTLNYVTPAVFLPQLTVTFTTSADDSVVAFLCNIIYFLVTRLVFAFVGFDAFLFKLQTVSLSIKDTLNDGTSLDFGEVLSLSLLALAFLQQILGIVQLGWFVRMRIFSFIFAGEDGQLSAQEEALKETWESMLAQRIWRDLPPKQALAAYLSYSDYDFQKLALETVKPGHVPKKSAHESEVKEDGVELTVQDS